MSSTSAPYLFHSKCPRGSPFLRKEGVEGVATFRLLIAVDSLDSIFKDDSNLVPSGIKKVS